MLRSLPMLALAPLALALASLPLASGCLLTWDQEGASDERMCDAMAAASVSVLVRTVEGGRVEGERVTWSVDGGTFEACDSMGRGEWVCGWEVSGAITVRVEARGYAADEQVLRVEDGVCHVEQERVDFALEPEAVLCDDSLVPSVIVEVVGSGGEDLSEVSLHWGYAGADMDPQLCAPLDAGDVAWVCGWEVSGELELYASARGHASQLLFIVVSADECHVRSEAVTIALDWTADAAPYCATTRPVNGIVSPRGFTSSPVHSTVAPSAENVPVRDAVNPPPSGRVCITSPSTAPGSSTVPRKAAVTSRSKSEFEQAPAPVRPPTVSTARVAVPSQTGTSSPLPDGSSMFRLKLPA